MLIDVKLGAAKAATIQVNDHDDPCLVAARFGWIYALSNEVVSSLEGLIRQRMTDQNIPMAQPGDDISASECSAKISEESEVNPTSEFTTLEHVVCDDSNILLIADDMLHV